MHHGTCRNACRDRLPAVAGKTFPAFPAHGHPQFYVSGKRPIVVLILYRRNLLGRSIGSFLRSYKCFVCGRLWLRVLGMYDQPRFYYANSRYTQAHWVPFRTALSYNCSAFKGTLFTDDYVDGCVLLFITMIRYMSQFSQCLTLPSNDENPVSYGIHANNEYICTT